MLCEQSGCGCALVVASGTITGSGTPADPWVLNVADSPSITQLQVDVANIYAALDSLPGTYVNATGDSMSGPLDIYVTGGGQIMGLVASGANYCYTAYYQDITRRGWVGAQVTTGHFVVNADVSNLLLSASLGDVVFSAAGSERMRLVGATLFSGKTASDIATVGLELFTSGAIYATRDITPACESLNKVGGGVASGTTFTDYRLSGSVIGSVTRNAATSAVLYNTSSDENLKNVIDELDPELCEYVLALVKPMMFSWKDDKGDTPIAGYIAQQVAAAWPQAVELGLVTPGYGDINARTWDSDGNETTPDGAWGPWQMSHAILIPLLHASLVRTTTKLSYLRAEHDDLVKRVEALEAAAK